ncbi:MAG: diguanylate cyclase [Thermoleophilia bacterium]|nr:diguanylate cyclase [Thermoleophilia bacterium]
MSAPQRVAATLSIGPVLAREGDTAASLVARADRLMYQSKREGRDRVSVTPAGPPSGVR